MLHIIGVSHFAQSRNPALEKTKEQETFTDLLRQTIKVVDPFFVGEEDCAEALANRNEVSIAKDVSAANDIEHRFCDPDQAHRRAMGYVSGADIFQSFMISGDGSISDDEARLKGYAIERGRYFPVREHYWLHGLVGCRDHSGIFVCGYGHLMDSFLELLEHEGIAYNVVRSDVGVTEAERTDVLRTAQYLKDHPELRKWEHRTFPLPTLIGPEIPRKDSTGP